MARHPKQLPPQKQESQPGIETKMKPRPESDDKGYIGSGKLKGKVVVITGGDSGIGRAVAIFFAKEGANIVISYLNEHEDAEETKKLVEQEGAACILSPGDVSKSTVCNEVISEAIKRFGKIDILVNNAAMQFPTESIVDITDEQLDKTFKTNIYSYFYMTRAAMPHMKEGACIINTTSVTAYKGSPQLLDYSSTKGAIVSFTRSLSQALASKNIRVNAVAPGPIWTPLMPATFGEEKVSRFGQDVSLGRPGQPEEVAPSYVFLASDDSSYITGQVLHPNGGTIVNG